MLRRLLVLSLALTSACQALPTIGILGFTAGDGVSAAEARAITALYTSALAGSGIVHVADSSVMNNVIKNRKGDSAVGFAEADLTDAGQLAGVSEICYGSFAKSGAAYVLTVLFYDVTFGWVNRTNRYSAAGIEDIPAEIKKKIDADSGKKWGAPDYNITSDIMCDLIRQDIDINASYITFHAKSFSRYTLLQIAGMTHNEPLWPLLGNLYPLPGAGLGSFFQGDSFGGLVSLGCSSTALLTVAGGLLMGSPVIATFGGFIYVGGMVFSVIRPFAYAAEYNGKVEKALGLHVSFNIIPSPGLVSNPTSDTYCLSFSARF